MFSIYSGINILSPTLALTYLLDHYLNKLESTLIEDAFKRLTTFPARRFLRRLLKIFNIYSYVRIRPPPPTHQNCSLTLPPGKGWIPAFESNEMRWKGDWMNVCAIQSHFQTVQLSFSRALSCGDHDLKKLESTLPEICLYPLDCAPSPYFHKLKHSSLIDTL